MPAGRSTIRIALALSLLVGTLLAAQRPAWADFHLMEVKEVFAGTTSQANADFVELRMKAPGQNVIGGHKLYLYGSPDVYGSVTRHECTIPTNVAANTAADARILFTTVEVQTMSPADFTIPPLLDGGGGAACFENIDCVSWGSFAGATTSPAGTPEPGGIPSGQSLERTGPDTNDSAADFEATSPTPVANGGGNLGTVTCQTGPPAPGGGQAQGQYKVKALTAKVRGRRATIKGQIDPPVPGEKVALTFFANGSPLRKIARKSATLNSQSRFSKRFAVPRESTRCKVKVQFQGRVLGQKKFRC
jgi:hypothetical protein